MIVHFVASKSGVRRELPYYRAITASIKQHGHTLAKDWVEEVNTLAEEGKLKRESESWKEVDKENNIAISNADVVIVDGTAKSFIAGYQVAQAANQKKPLLILTRDKSPVGISGLSTPSGFVKSVVYDDSNLDEIIGEFLTENTIETKDLRFNFVLDRQTYTYLRWMSEKTGKSKGEIVRNLIQRDMQKGDED